MGLLYITDYLLDIQEEHKNNILYVTTSTDVCLTNQPYCSYRKLHVQKTVCSLKHCDQVEAEQESSAEQWSNIP